VRTLWPVFLNLESGVFWEASTNQEFDFLRAAEKIDQQTVAQMRGWEHSSCTPHKYTGLDSYLVSEVGVSPRLNSPEVLPFSNESHQLISSMAHFRSLKSRHHA
jgi:hypothetical protein